MTALGEQPASPLMVPCIRGMTESGQLLPGMLDAATPIGIGRQAS